MKCWLNDTMMEYVASAYREKEVRLEFSKPLTVDEYKNVSSIVIVDYSAEDEFLKDRMIMWWPNMTHTLTVGNTSTFATKSTPTKSITFPVDCGLKSTMEGLYAIHEVGGRGENWIAFEYGKAVFKDFEDNGFRRK